jgi:hypothetical protein
MPVELAMPNHVKGVTVFRVVIYPKMELAKYVRAGSLKPTKDILQILGR